MRIPLNEFKINKDKLATTGIKGEIPGGNEAKTLKLNESNQGVSRLKIKSLTVIDTVFCRDVNSGGGEEQAQ